MPQRPKLRAKPKVYAGTQVIVRASRILKQIGAAAPRGLRVVDLCDRLAIERPTVHRILSCLMAEGLVVRNENGKQYLLGARFTNSECSRQASSTSGKFVKTRSHE